MLRACTPRHAPTYYGHLTHRDIQLSKEGNLHPERSTASCMTAHAPPSKRWRKQSAQSSLRPLHGRTLPFSRQQCAPAPCVCVRDGALSCCVCMWSTPQPVVGAEAPQQSSARTFIAR